MLKLVEKLLPLGPQIGRVLKKTPSLTYSQKRFFITKFLNRGLNLFNKERFDLLGADRNCAEWILRSGGRVRWKGTNEWILNYNDLPGEDEGRELYKLQDIDMTEAGVMAPGFQHLNFLEDIKSIKMHNCPYVNDDCLKQLECVRHLVEMLQVSECKLVTDKGLMSLKQMICLQELHLKDLRGVTNKDKCYEVLQTALPDCEIVWPDIEEYPKDTMPRTVI